MRSGRALTAAVAALSIVGCTAAASGGSPMSPRAPAAPSLTIHRPGDAVSVLRTDPYYPAIGSTTFDALHYGLDLTWDATQRRLSGTATIRFRAPRAESQFSLDLDRVLHPTAVTVDGKPATFVHQRHVLQVRADLASNTRHTVAVTYSGIPKPYPAPTTRKDIPDLGWTTTKTGQAWTMQEPYGAFTWYPSNDQPSDKATYDITVHNQAAWNAVANGQLVGDTVTGDERTMHWRLGAPAASYLVTVAIGPYRAHHATGPHGLPLTYWVRPADDGDLDALAHSPAMLRWLEKRLGRFPFSSLGVVLVPSTSGMETETMVTLGAPVLRHEYGLADLLHEFAHQWYGDEVTPNNWRDLWMNESFATYLQILWQSTHHQGGLASWEYTLAAEDQHLRAKYGPPGEYDKRNFAELDVYYCGARMLFELRHKLGPRTFARVLRGWPRSRRFGDADRGNWINYLDATTHRNLRAFVTRWLDSKTSPG